MNEKRAYLYAAAVVVFLIIAYYAYQQGWLNAWLPAEWDKHKSGFVGAYGRTPGMQNCLAYGDPQQRWPHFNRCTWA